MTTLKQSKQANNLTNTPANKQINKLTNTKIGIIRGVNTSQYPINQLNPLAQVLSVTVYDVILLQISVETPTTGFRQLIFNILCEDVHSQLWACQAVGANHHHCSSIVTIQGSVTGIICRVVTPKDIES